MTKATKNNGTFEALNTREGIRYSAKRANMEIVLTPCENYYHGTVWMYDRPKVDAQGETATWTLSRLAKATNEIVWTDENTSKEVFDLAKDLNAFIKRPKRETYNNR